MTGNAKSTRLSVTGGVIAKIGGPVYFKAGVGYGMILRCCETASGDYVEYMPNTYKGVDLTAGLQFNLRNLTIGIDAGHGGWEYGAVIGGVYESNLNVAITNKVIEKLNAAGIDVISTREDDSYVGVYERALLANNADATLFVSIHNNASSNINTSGTSTYHYSTSPNGIKLATNIQDKLVATLDSYYFGIFAGDHLTVIYGTKMPAVLVEVGFMSNTDELGKLKKEAYIDKAAEAICQGIIKTLDEMEE